MHHVYRAVAQNRPLPPGFYAAVEATPPQLVNLRHLAAKARRMGIREMAAPAAAAGG